MSALRAISIPDLEWFENVCLEIDRNPSKATAAIMEFREQSYALELSNTWIKFPQCSALAKFQLALIMQYCSLKNWMHMPSTATAALRDTLWTLIYETTIQATMPTYALNKLLQVYALFWKRGWCEMSESTKNQLFSQIESMCTNSTSQSNDLSTSSAFIAGVKLLTTTVEEFESRNTSEIGLPLEFHNKSHDDFERIGLSQCLRLAHLCLTRCTQKLSLSTSNIQNFAEAIPMVTESVKAYVEILNWTFGGSTTSTQSDMGGSRSADKKSSNLLHLPREWAPHLLNREFQDCIHRTYTQVRHACLHYIEILHVHRSANIGSTVFGDGCSLESLHQQLRISRACLAELRTIMISLGSISGPHFFQSDDERTVLGDTLLQAVEPFLSSWVTVEGDHNITTAASLSLLAENTENSYIFELCSEECLSFATLMQRILGNFKTTLCSQMAAFEAVMLTTGRLVLKLSSYLTRIAEKNVAHLSCGKDVIQDDTLLDSATGHAVVLLTEVWCMVLDDPMLVDPMQSASLRSKKLRHYLSTMSAQVFISLFDCYLHMTLYEALAGCEDDEEDDEEQIDARSKDEVLMAVCTVGRLDICTSLNYIISTASAVLTEAEGILQQANAKGTADDATLNGKCLRILEILRICFLFLTHLFVEDFHSEVASGYGSDTPTVPQLLLEAALDDAQGVQERVKSAYWLAMRVLHMETRMVSNESQTVRHHPLVSAYLLQFVLRFVREFFLRYVRPDPALYHEMYATNILLREPDAEFMTSIELILEVTHTLMQHMPLEPEVIENVSRLVVALSKCRPQPHWPQAVISLPSAAKIFEELSDTGLKPCRLSLSGRSQMFGALGCLAIRAGNVNSVMRLCTYVDDIAQSLSSITSKADMQLSENKHKFEVCVFCLRGMAGTPSGMDKVLRELFDRCLPVLSWSLHAFGEADDLVSGVIYMLRDYAEHKLDALPQASSLMLYRSTFNFLERLVVRLHAQPSAAALGSQAALDVEEAWKSDTMLVVLQLLNHLVCKDFFLDCEDDEDVAAAAAASRLQGSGASPSGTRTPKEEVTDILIFAFRAVVPAMSEALLQTYSLTCDRYFAFVAYMFNSYAEQISIHLANDSTGRLFLGTLMKHLLWAAGAIDPTAARLALQTVQSMASYEHQAMKLNKPSLGAACAIVFSSALDRLLEMIFYPNSADYGIAWDRIDACGNALLALIALDSTHFLHSAHAIVAQFATKYPTAQQGLFECFEKLTKARGVDMSSLDRRNRQSFCANFREFCQAVRPLIQV